jgi:hypothetical protein
LSMPRADAWVQEFIRHGIPCVSADYRLITSASLATPSTDMFSSRQTIWPTSPLRNL